MWSLVWRSQETHCWRSFPVILVILPKLYSKIRSAFLFCPMLALLLSTAYFISSVFTNIFCKWFNFTISMTSSPANVIKLTVFFCSCDTDQILSEQKEKDRLLPLLLGHFHLCSFEDEMTLLYLVWDGSGLFYTVQVAVPFSIPICIKASIPCAITAILEAQLDVTLCEMDLIKSFCNVSDCTASVLKHVRLCDECLVNRGSTMQEEK